MNLSALLPLLERTLPPLSSTTLPTVLGVHEAAKAGALAALARPRAAPLVLIVARPDRAAAIAEELAAWLGSEQAVAVFPEQDTVPFQRVARDTLATEQRLELLRRLASAMPPTIVVTSGLALAQTTIAPAAFAGATETLRIGAKLSLEGFLASLHGRGYEVGPLVESPGQASRRGGIVDVYPPEGANPVRIEFLGDTIESLRSFDPATQRSLKRLAEVLVGPAREALDGAGRIAELRSALDLSGLPPELEAQCEDELDRLAAGESDAGGGFWLPFLTSSTLLDHLPQDALLVVDEPAEVRQVLAGLDDEAEEARDARTGQHRIPRHLPLPHVDHETLMSAVDARVGVQVLRWATAETPGALTTPFEAAGAFGGR